MVEAVTSLLENFSHENRDVGRQLEALLNEDPSAFQRAVVQYLLTAGHQPSSARLIWLLQREGKLLDLLLNAQQASLEDSIIIAKIMTKVIKQLDVQLARLLSAAPDELAARILRMLAEISDSNRTLPLLTTTLRNKSPKLRSKAAFIFARHCQNSVFIERALKDNDPKVRASALEGLSVSDYSTDPSVFVDALADADLSVQAQALVACYRMGDAKRALQLIEDMSRHEEAAFRATAVWAMGEMGDRRCVPLLERLHEDAVAEVRGRAVEALKKVAASVALQAAEAAERRSHRKLRIDSLFAVVDEKGGRQVYLAVRDSSGNAVTDLEGSDFHVAERGEEVANRRIDSPLQRDSLSLAYVLDCSGSMSADKTGEMTAALLQSMEDKQPQDQMSVYKYAFDVARVIGFTDSLKRLSAAIRQPYLGAKNVSRLHDAMWQALEDVIPEQGYRAVVAVADGTDRGSEHAFSAIVREFRRAAVPLYVIGFDCGIAAPSLRSLAEQAGGLFLPARNALELNGVCRLLLRRLEAHYLIRYELKEKPDDFIRLWIEGSAGSGNTSVVPVVI